ncbi:MULTISPECIES: acyl-homoserine-lactone synthase [unclassified Bosea (in: a-proteobacteria)]|uniref:acyl-homoserine-lactone synthase n=1 Tax=unclassified Bosea (in: a-proteobacteria) TaxID=2653178 RepID=UPI000F757947|nr:MULTISPECIES: acyl-homoserine-lactone synthase [unclassified Bosea (in: a-proteobacteria)]AZO82099.1 autoinducer synthase [Bosea sp. Tri-49]RXT24675.1 autoinducer synthase [Bosea sp. Tri-39]RXT42510.1 autoinducer synthase [Bosea sp. Tri-54]
MLLAIPGTDIHPHAAPMERACQFRHKIFVDDRDWSDLDQAGCNHTVHRICLRDEDIVGYQRLLTTTRPILLTNNLADLCWKRPPTDQRTFERTRFCVAPGWRDTRSKGDEPLLELAQGVVEWALAHRVGTLAVAIDWRLVVIAMQLRFFVRPLGFPKRIGRDEVVALRMSFDRETLHTIQEARGPKASVLREAALATAA